MTAEVNGRSTHVELTSDVRAGEVTCENAGAIHNPTIEKSS